MSSLPADGLPLFLTLLGVVAFLYASVGHGGASGYLALMALWAFPVSVMKPTALTLNLFVAGASFLMFFRQGHFNRRLFLSFALASVPMAFLGGMMDVGWRAVQASAGCAAGVRHPPHPRHLREGE
jgi:uncharacterized membrane protein YfcA